MPQREDRIEIGEFVHARPWDGDRPAPRDGSKPFLSIWFRCCHTYGRIYRNHDRTAYQGRCPKCGAMVQALIGPGGTETRTFEAR